MSHTPGPWMLDYVVDGAYAIHGTAAGDQILIATRAPIPRLHEEFVANAHLIAAAPDLLAAVHRAVETIRALHDIGLIGSPHAAEEMWALYQQSPEMQAIHAAITKAEGRTEAAS